MRNLMALFLFFASWVAVWGATVGTWQYDATGASIGMAPVAIPLHFLLPLLLGGLIGRWRADAPRIPWKSCVGAALAFGVAHFAIVPTFLRPVWNPRAETGPEFWLLQGEALVFGIVYLVVCVGGALAGAALSRKSVAARSGQEST
jgi:hypothetical protein